MTSSEREVKVNNFDFLQQEISLKNDVVLLNVFPFVKPVFTLKQFHLNILEEHPQESKEHLTETRKGYVIKQVHRNSTETARIQRCYEGNPL